MTLFTLETRQLFSADINELWRFLADPKNLKVITPHSMNFEVISGGDCEMFAGQLIQYKVTVLPAIRVRWLTEITHLEQGRYFVDEQRAGPYRFWQHQHRISAVPGGTLMEDQVSYGLWGGPLAYLLNTVVIQPKLKEIFEFRQKELARRFGALPETQSQLQFS